MKDKSFAEELQEIRDAGERFLMRREDEILHFLVKTDVTAEEALRQEILSELLDKIQRVDRLIQYLEKNRIQMGRLKRNPRGKILFNADIMPPMQEFEVYVYDKEIGRAVWTRTFVSITADKEIPYLVGLGRQLEIDGLIARIRS